MIIAIEIWPEKTREIINRSTDINISESLLCKMCLAPTPTPLPSGIPPHPLNNEEFREQYPSTNQV